MKMEDNRHYSGLSLEHKNPKIFLALRAEIWTIPGLGNYIKLTSPKKRLRLAIRLKNPARVAQSLSMWPTISGEAGSYGTSIPSNGSRGVESVGGMEHISKLANEIGSKHGKPSESSIIGLQRNIFFL
uniref:Uncharacterized protein n=1 Tax=Romanomermis culicivorax TaxID=13658 RepID=A0A915L197_ROMCU